MSGAHNLFSAAVVPLQDICIFSTHFFKNTRDMDGKTKAIVAHLTLIGWIIALVLNSQEKDEYASFYIRQMLGLIILNLVWIIPILGWIVGLVVLVFWVMSIIGAASGEQKLLPVVGQYFQDWFKAL
jgi:uncharacterized membrane protein